MAPVVWAVREVHWLWRGGGAHHAPCEGPGLVHHYCIDSGCCLDLLCVLHTDALPLEVCNTAAQAGDDDSADARGRCSHQGVPHMLYDRRSVMRAPPDSGKVQAEDGQLEHQSKGAVEEQVLHSHATLAKVDTGCTSAVA